MNSPTAAACLGEAAKAMHTAEAEIARAAREAEGDDKADATLLAEEVEDIRARVTALAIRLAP